MRAFSNTRPFRASLLGVTLARKSTRRITVGAVAYRWKVRPRLTPGQKSGRSPLMVAVEHADEPGTTLVIRLAVVDDWTGWPDRIVKPATVAAGIEAALAAGWEPTEPGPTFTVTLS